MKSITIQAEKNELSKVQSFINLQLISYNCSDEFEFQLNLIIEEIFTNIVGYAYAPDIGDVTVNCDIEGKPPTIIIQFIDRGKQYNPLKKADPDITLGVEKREIGGLGVFLVKKFADDVKYEYINNENIFTIMKKI